MLQILETALSSLNNLDNLAMRITASKLGLVAIATLSLILGAVNQLPSAHAGVDLYYSGMIAPSLRNIRRMSRSTSWVSAPTPRKLSNRHISLAISIAALDNASGSS